MNGRKKGTFELERNSTWIKNNAFMQDWELWVPRRPMLAPHQALSTRNVQFGLAPTGH